MSRTARPGAHEEILEAARAEFARAGLDRARVEDIARRAGVSKGAFYLHFSSKDDALKEILQRFLGAMDAAASRREGAEVGFLGGISPDDPDLLDRLVKYEAKSDLEFLEALWLNRAMLAALDGAGNHVFARMIDEFRRRTRAYIAARIAARQRLGVMRSDVRAEVIGDVIFGAYEAFGRHMSAMAEKPDLEAWARQIHLVLADGLLHRPVAAPQPRKRTRNGNGNGKSLRRTAP
ncbi:MAG TPA: helix-turn-helix domain-containing protein [Myxococcales bacterium]|jgi:AcrR family transcriptional regulator